MSDWNFQKIIKVAPDKEFQIFFEFEDGKKGTYNLSDHLGKPIFEPLKDRDFFEQVSLDDWGAPCWPNGFDISPEVLYERAE